MQHVKQILPLGCIAPVERQRSFIHLLKMQKLIRGIEAHNGLSALVAESSHVNDTGHRREFDFIWESSLTDSTSRGKPDNSSVDMSSRIERVEEIIEVTRKPIIVDADNGGLIEHFRFHVRTLDRIGTSAIIIEDKVGPKRNSLFGNSVGQTQDNPEVFAEKIREGREGRISEDLMIIARIESLILEQGLNDALSRADVYVDAGADGIMIHSQNKDPQEVKDFAKEFRNVHPNIPLVSVPTSYASITENELEDLGFNIVIYANQLLRSAYPAMLKTAKDILKYGRALETENYCMSIKEIINLIGTK